MTGRQGLARRVGVMAVPVLLFVGGCAGPIVSLQHGYNFQTIHRVAVLGLDDFPRAPGSGNLCTSMLEKHFIAANYQVVERQRIEQVMSEQRLDASGAIDPETAKKIGQILGVDALVLGNLTEFVPSREQTVMVEVVEVKSEPNMVKVVRQERRRVESDDSRKPRYEWVPVEEEVQKGARTTRTVRKVPETHTEDARVGLVVRLVEVNSGEVLWVGSDSEEESSADEAAEFVSRRILRAVKNTWPRK